MILKKIKKLFFLVAIFLFFGCFQPENNLIINPIGKNSKEEFRRLPVKNEKISILFVGDLMFDRSIRQFAEKKGNDFIFSEISEFLKSNDLVVANLEGPITDKKSVSQGTVFGESGHFLFTFDKGLVGTLKKNKINLVNIGNNHILNFGVEGLNQTRKYLEEGEIDYFGDPKNKEKNYIIQEIGGINVGFVCFNQFGGKAEWAENNIIEIKNKSDILIVYAHWGKEYVKVPSESIKNAARNFIDIGADLIIGTHPHVIQNREEYQGKVIYYSLGNFIFDQYFGEDTQNGLAVKITINLKDKKLEFQEYPLFMDKNGRTLPNFE